MKRFCKILLLCIFLTASFPVTAFSASMPDLQNHWSSGDVHKLIQRGAIGGYPDGTFHPDNTITRAEFCKILRQSLQLPSIEGNTFADTAEHWAVTDIYTLIEQNIIVPQEYGTAYRPDNAITRREIAIMLVRAMGLNDSATDLSGQATGFSDDADIPSYDKGYLYLAKELGLVGGYEDGTFRPAGKATRAEASVMIVRFLQLKEGNDHTNLPVVPEPQEQPSSEQNNGQAIEQIHYQLTLQHTAKSERNALGEQYISAILQLHVQNQSAQSVTISNTMLKTIVTYSQGAQITAIQPAFSQTIDAGQTATIATTIQILLPNNTVAAAVLGDSISQIETSLTFGNQTIFFADIDTALLQAVTMP